MLFSYKECPCLMKMMHETRKTTITCGTHKAWSQLDSLGWKGTQGFVMLERGQESMFDIAAMSLPVQ